MKTVNELIAICDHDATALHIMQAELRVCIMQSIERYAEENKRGDKLLLYCTDGRQWTFEEWLAFERQIMSSIDTTQSFSDLGKLAKKAGFRFKA